MSLQLSLNFPRAALKRLRGKELIIIVSPFSFFTRNIAYEGATDAVWEESLRVRKYNNYLIARSVVLQMVYGMPQL
jgi:hypothetical protein